MYTLYKFHFLNGISEINQLFDDILIIWPAPVYYKCLCWLINNMGVSQYQSRTCNIYPQNHPTSEACFKTFTIIIIIFLI